MYHGADTNSLGQETIPQTEVSAGLASGGAALEREFAMVTQPDDDSQALEGLNAIIFYFFLGTCCIILLLSHPSS
jgi:hypothetical protein